MVENEIKILSQDPDEGILFQIVKMFPQNPDPVLK